MPEYLIVLERHVDNQFQLPILFLVTGVLAITLKNQSPLIITLSWAFIASRFVHSYIHLGKNNILKRAAVYGLGWVFIVAIWILLLF